MINKFEKEASMNKKEFKELAKRYLRLKIEHENNRVKISLMCEGECIDSDFLDYTEVVRVVDRLNAGMYQ